MGAVRLEKEAHRPDGRTGRRIVTTISAEGASRNGSWVDVPWRTIERAEAPRPALRSRRRPPAPLGPYVIESSPSFRPKANRPRPNPVGFFLFLFFGKGRGFYCKGRGVIENTLEGSTPLPRKLNRGFVGQIFQVHQLERGPMAGKSRRNCA